VRDVSMPKNGSIMSDVAIGKVYRTTIFLKVQWMWLSLPSAVWAISLIIWLGTIWKCRKVSAPLWRDSVMPLLFILPESKGTDSVAEVAFGLSSTGYAMRAEHMNVRLVKKDGHFKLVDS
jgi:hypothetical protein